MDQLEPISIAIIGGADGPTSIYISKQSLWMLIIEIFICIVIFIFAIYGLIRSIKKKKNYKISCMWNNYPACNFTSYYFWCKKT